MMDALLCGSLLFLLSACALACRAARQRRRMAGFVLLVAVAGFLLSTAMVAAEMAR